VSDERFVRLKEIVARVAELPVAEREDYLAEISKTDPDLWKEVEAMLSYDEEYPEILRTGATVFSGTEALPTGTTVSHYRIIEKIGEGGMGIVYKAEDSKLGRLVALKFLAREIVGNKEARARLVHEARTAAVLDHPNICTIHETGELEDQMFIVMAYVEGQTLRAMIRSGPLDTEQVVGVARQIAEGLRAAHDKGIVHRDIKPSNIMVTPDGRAKIMDFGLARSAEQADLTKTGMIMGTASYMSPEQARGERVDHRTDIWSLGAVLHEALTGERPFKGASTEAVIYSILHDEPRPLANLRKDVPEELGIIVSNALEKAPEERYQSTEELLTDMTAVADCLRGDEQSSDLVQIHKQRRAKEAARLRRRLTAAARRWWAMIPVAAIVIVAVVVGVNQMVSELAEAPLIPDRVVVAAFENRTGDQSLDHLGMLAGEWMLDGVSEIELGEVVPTVYAASSLVGSNNDSDREREAGIRTLAEKAGAGLVISGRYHLLGDSIQFRASLSKRPGERTISTVTSGLTGRVAPFDAIEEFRQRMMGGLAIHLSPEIMLDSYMSPPVFEAYREHCAGRKMSGKDFAAAMDHHARAIQLDSTFVEPYLSLASAYFNIDDYAAGEELLRILELRRAKLTEMQRLGLDFMLTEFQGRRREGWRYLMQAGRIAPESDLVKYHMIWVAPEMRRPRMAIELCEEMGGPGRFMRHGLMGYFWYANFTDALHQVGEYEREIEVIREARERFPDVVHPWLVEARALAAIGRIDELNRLLQECPTTRPTWWFTVGRLLTGVARELRVHGYREAAQDIANRAVEWSQKLQFELYPGQDARSHVARSLYVAERWQEAREVYKDLARENPSSVFYLGATGRVAARLGNREKAVAVLDELQAIDRPYIFGAHDYASAQIASILGDYEQAVVLLSKAFDQTYEYTSSVLNDPDLLLMRGYPAWEELIRPKG
jgi:tetratricopeptide (TPR) repeat protein/predicted Ser/Thr protein kinase